VRNKLLPTADYATLETEEQAHAYAVRIDALQLPGIVLATGSSTFFPHRDPAIVKWMSERKLIIRALKPQRRLSGVSSRYPW